MKLGERIRYERQRMGLTVVQLAAQAGIDAGAVGRIERGTTQHPQRSTLLRLAEALNLNPEDLGVKADGQTRERENYRPRFAYCRRATGHSQGEAAHRLAIRAKTLDAYETGLSFPPAWLIVTMCQLYGVSADYLLGIPLDRYKGRFCMIGFCEAGLLHDHCCADCEHRTECGDACQNSPSHCGYCRTKRPHEMLARKEVGFRVAKDQLQELKDYRATGLSPEQIDDWARKVCDIRSALGFATMAECWTGLCGGNAGKVESG